MYADGAATGIIIAVEKIPLDEAAGRGLIPCSVCGAPGAAVREAGGKKHFLCPGCAARGRRWAWPAVALAAAALLGGAWLLSSRREEAPPGPSENLVREVKVLAGEGKAGEARERLREALRLAPEDPGLHLLMGRCLRQMSRFEASIPHWKAAFERLPEAREESGLELGTAHFRMGRAKEAFGFLEKPFETPVLDHARRMALAECCLELELYEDALKTLEGWPPHRGVLWIRHRALSFLGRADEARKAIEALEGQTPEDRLTRAILGASLSREEGDFAAAGKALEAALGQVDRGSPDWARLKRSEIALRIEGGETEALAALTDELAGSSEGHAAGVALWGRAIGRLLAGKRDEAAAAAREFLSRTDPEFTPLRMERLMMLHLAGQLKEEALEEEVRALSRTWQNDLLYYMALSRGGDRALAERALRATPGRNFPYHAIRRLLK